jgi:hypothetical protein
MFATTILPDSELPARLNVYQGNCTKLTCVCGTAAYECSDTFPSMFWDSVAGTIYHIQVTNAFDDDDYYYYYGSCTDPGSFTLRVDGTDAPLIQTESKWSCFILRLFFVFTALSHHCLQFQSVLIHGVQLHTG